MCKLSKTAGDILTSLSQQPLPEGKHSFQAEKIAWVYHDEVGYIMGKVNPVSLSVGPQTGACSEIGTGSSEPVTLPVFNLWIDHGYARRAGTYESSILPGASVKQVAEHSTTPVMRVLSNQEDIQAVWHGELKILMVVFRKPGAVTAPIGRVRVDHSCLLLARKGPRGWKITASNPENQPLILQVEAGGVEIAINLPGGYLAGSSVSTDLPAG